MGYPDFQTYQALATLISEALASAGIPILGNPVLLYGGTQITPGAALVGCTVTANTYGTDTPIQAAEQLDSYLSRPAAVTVQKVFYNEGGWPAGIPMPESQLIANGIALFLSLKPSRTLSASEGANVTNALNMYTAAGATVKCSLWEEPFKAMTAAQYVAYAQYYAPYVRAAGVPLVWDINGDDEARQMGYYPGDAYVDEITVDYYCQAWNNGQTLNTVQSIADGAIPKKPLGLAEFGATNSVGFVPTLAQWTAYTNYLTQFYSDRLAAGKSNGWVIGWGSYDPSKPDEPPGNLFNGANDYKIPGYQSVFDALSPLPNPNIPIAAGATVVLNPLTPTPGGNYATADGMSYDITVNLTAGSGSTVPFCAVSMTWLNDDIPGAVGVTDPVWMLPMGINGGQGATVTGAGPQRKRLLAVSVTNLDTVSCEVQVTINSAGRQVQLDDWRWTSMGCSVPGFTAPSGLAGAGTLLLGAIDGHEVAANGGTLTRLLSLYAGRVGVMLNTGAASMQYTLNPAPDDALLGTGSNFGIGNGFGGLIAGTGRYDEVIFGRTPYVLTVTNMDNVQRMVYAQVWALEA